MTSPGWFTPTRLVMATFFVQAFAVNNWFPRIPDVQAELGIGPAELSIALLGMPIGGFIATLIAARPIDKVSPRRAMLAGLVAFGLVAILPGIVWSVASLFVALFLMGAAYLVIDVSANVEATRIQARSGRRILATCHGFWSLGAMAGLVVGSAFAEYDVPTAWHMLIVVVASVPVGMLIAVRLPVVQAATPAGGERAPVVSLPTLAMAGVCIFAFGAILAELTARNWGAVFFREQLAASPAAAGVGLAAFSLGMAVFRLLGDRLTERFGAAALGRACAVAAVAGLAMVVFADGVLLAIAGLGLLGVGVSLGFPLAVSAAAAVPGRTPAANVAALSLVAYSGTLVGPPLVGFVAQAFDLRIGLAAILPLMVLSALFAGSLGRGHPRAAGDDAAVTLPID